MDRPRHFERKQLRFGGTRQSPVVRGSGWHDSVWYIRFVGAECACTAGRHGTANRTNVGHSLVPKCDLSDWNRGASQLVPDRISHRALLDCARHAVVSRVRGTKWTTGGGLDGNHQESAHLSGRAASTCPAWCGGQVSSVEVWCGRPKRPWIEAVSRCQAFRRFLLESSRG
jgi:hypothetical protein